jgi:diadenosine tetraphosphate (Ap4A) HIT family hydrolase
MTDLDPRIAADTHPVGELPLSHLLLKRDRRVPWCLLVPRRPGLTEVHQMDRADRAQLMEEIALLSAAIERGFGVDKINVAMLGNVVPQLHVHVVGRRTDDFAWPGPTLGVPGAQDYGAEELAEAAAVLRREMDLG